MTIRSGAGWAIKHLLLESVDQRVHVLVAHRLLCGHQRGPRLGLQHARRRPCWSSGGLHEIRMKRILKLPDTREGASGAS